MLRAEDLSDLVAIVGEAQLQPPGSGTAPPIAIARDASDFRCSDLQRLTHIAKIAAAAGDIDESVAHVAQRIAEKARNGHLAILSERTSWISAARWGLDEVLRMPPFHLPPGATSRAQEVGRACERLRKQNYTVHIDGNGSYLNDQSRKAILTRINSLACVLGGLTVLDQLFRVLRDQSRFHSGIWLLGDIVPTLQRGKEPSLPYGWLLSLGIRHLDSNAIPKNPATAWGQLTKLMTDYAAVVDVERYHAIDGSDVPPGNAHIEFAASLGWHQLFTFPRFTKSAIRRLFRSLKNIVTHEDRSALGYDLNIVEAEALALLSSTMDDRPITVPETLFAQRYPILFNWPHTPQARPNARVFGPFDTERKDQQRHLFFPGKPGQTLLLPTSLTAAHIATLLMESIWRGLKRKRAETVVGLVCEQAVGDICRMDGKTIVQSDLKYNAAGTHLQIDVLVEREQCLTLLEVKSKALTAQAMSGDLLKFLADFKDSYLSMLLQLIRHERHIRNDHPDLPKPVGNDRVAKVAVSPLSFGPLSDASFNRTMVLALAQSRLVPKGDNKEIVEIIKGIHENVDAILTEFMALLPKEPDERFDIRSELMDYHWLDIAQLDFLGADAEGLYASLKKLRHVSFSTRDFWSEIVYLKTLARCGEAD